MEIRYFTDYDIISPLTTDNYCKIFLGEHRFLKKKVIIKFFNNLNDKEYSTILMNLQKIQHVNLLKPIVVEQESDNVIFVYDFDDQNGCQFLNLQDLISRQDFLSEELVYSLLMQVASAIDYLNEQQIGFANLKLTNCLVKEINKNDISLVLVDYINIKQLNLKPVELFERTMQNCINRSSEAKEDLVFKYRLNQMFLAPEVTDKNSNSIALNSYSFGVLAYYLLTKLLPSPVLQSVDKVQNLQYSWDQMILSLVQFDPELRPKKLLDLLQTVLKKHDDVVKKEVKIKEMIKEIQKDPTIKSLDNVNNELKPILKAQEINRPIFDPDPAQIFHTESMIAPYRPKEKEQTNIVPIPSEMAIVPEGEYIRGSNEGARDERPAHKVFLSSFAMDVHPVTNEQFVRFLEVMGGEKDNHNNDLIRLRESRIKRSGGKLIIESGYAKHPVVGVSWYGALGYAKWVGKRLPTEAEWEVASRSLKPDLIYPTGLNIERTHANFFSADTTPVASYPPIDIGLYDMAGNVYEWCHDWYDYNYYENSLQEPTNPKGPQQGVYRVLRGGCWKSLKDDLRCAHRHRNNPGTVNKTYGFRCAADVERA